MMHLLQCYGKLAIPNASMSKYTPMIELILEQLHLIGTVFSGFGIAFEQAHKRVEILYYCIPKTLEAVWNLLEKRNIVKTLPF